MIKPDKVPNENESPMTIFVPQQIVAEQDIMTSISKSRTGGKLNWKEQTTIIEEAAM